MRERESESVSERERDREREREGERERETAAESWFCTFLLPCRFLSRVSLGKIKGIEERRRREGGFAETHNRQIYKQI